MKNEKATHLARYKNLTKWKRSKCNISWPLMVFKTWQSEKCSLHLQLTFLTFIPCLMPCFFNPNSQEKTVRTTSCFFSWRFRASEQLTSPSPSCTAALPNHHDFSLVLAPRTEELTNVPCHAHQQCAILNKKSYQDTLCFTNPNAYAQTFFTTDTLDNMGWRLWWFYICRNMHASPASDQVGSPTITFTKMEKNELHIPWRRAPIIKIYGLFLG